MKIKNRELNGNTIEQINKLIEMDLSPSAAFKLALAVRELTDIIKIKADSEAKIIAKYTSKDENGNPIPATDNDGNVIENHVKINNMDEFNKEMEEFMEVDIDINIQPIEISTLGVEHIKTSMLLPLSFLFV